MTIYKPTSLPADRDAIVRDVFHDVLDGLADYLQAESFDVVGPFAATGALIDGGIAVEQWEFVGIDNGKGFNNLWPTAKRVLVRGVTFVELDEEPRQFHRHVDWNGVSSQLGGSLGRAATPIVVTKREDALFYAAHHYDVDAETE
jgi:hypothetical protein